jgi:homoserine O-acetyltransferase
MVALEWAATFPTLTRDVLVFAAPAAHTAQAVAFGHIQREALRVGGTEGLALARMMAMTTYRTDGEMEARFGRRRREDGVFQVASYLSHQGRKLVERFDPQAYRTLLDAMDVHDVGRGRGGVGRALSRFGGVLTGVGIPGDRLYPPAHVRAWTLAAGARYREIHSQRGHDAFLLESGQAGALLRESLARARRETRPLPPPHAAGDVPGERRGGGTLPLPGAGD